MRWIIPMQRMKAMNTMPVSTSVMKLPKGSSSSPTLAYTGGNSSQDTWFEENTEWATQLRYSAYDPPLNIFVSRQRSDAISEESFAGRQVRRQNYIINGRLNFSRFLDQQNKHQLTVEVAAELQSNRANSTDIHQQGILSGAGA